MKWWRRMVRKPSVPTVAKETTKNEGDGILKLHEDVQTCEYGDILVMWEMLQSAQYEGAQEEKLKPADR
ncbi:hypothetical protein HPP92_016817 [Vanilla planifolia]|uniref:Uncharacterized protein n=1 Tax=Vanilla planifolia TaxID=51239 RepID=A0A835QKT6_VANPL|nr:hypothetical protein HPP92_017402 [Vanilla planifolia]KAG0472271.1 hypothetical protein HPP92_016817 [Vanilla planifolia]